jgi:hypothetical protein
MPPADDPGEPLGAVTGYACGGDAQGEDGPREQVLGDASAPPDRGYAVHRLSDKRHVRESAGSRPD